ncbi:hypothetical protein [Hoeflea sp. TYP-13]|uniref:hypothetical protein n=1 Tax=Hoeflea sp. TYP-13 TaxID=3230023 RepID=UPI0034C5FCCA
MSPLIETIRRVIGDGDLPAIELAQFESELVAVTTRDSLGALIASALAFRKQGRMGDAISQITRANRAQLDAIEGIMHKLDGVLERPKSEVVFAKYRQVFPFEMGVENADDVLDLVRVFYRDTPSDISSKIGQLHSLEAAWTEETTALEFFKDRFQNGGAEAEIEQAQGKLDSIAEELEDVRSAIVGAVTSVVVSELDRHEIGAKEPSAIYEISGWLYQIVTSPTLTKPAKKVEIHD